MVNVHFPTIWPKTASDLLLWAEKNWLFSDTPKGASASAAIYSIVETAKANGLNVHTYLNHLLLYMPDADYQNDPEVLEELMPWSQRIQAECKL